MGTSFVATMLAMHPEYQEKVFQEISIVIPDKTQDPTQDDLQKLTFTDLCIRETLRLFPSVPLISRYSTKPFRLANGIIVPENIPIIIGLRQIHLQEKYYGLSANLFNPYRFQDEQIKHLPAAAYIPFSFGPRNCIGFYYAQVSVKLYIVHLIRNYRLTTSYKNIEDLKLLQNGSLRLVDNHMIKLERRH